MPLRQNNMPLLFVFAFFYNNIVPESDKRFEGHYQLI